MAKIDYSGECKYKAVTVVPWREFRDLIMTEGVSTAIAIIEGWDAASRKLARDRYSNSEIRITNTYGQEFKVIFSEPETGKYFMNLWALDDTAINYKEIIPEGRACFKYFERLITMLDKFTDGMVDCADCGKTVPFDQVKHNRFYAGVYCQTCWDTKWRAVEAKETYN